MIFKSGYADRVLGDQKALAEIAPDIYELVRLVKMAQQPGQGAANPVPPAAAPAPQGGQQAAGQAQPGAGGNPAPNFLGDESGIAAFAKNIASIVERLWNNEYGRALLLSLIIGTGGGGILEILGGGQDASLSSILRSILLWGVLGTILGVGGKFIYDWIVSGKSSTEIFGGMVKDVLGEAISNFVSGINPVPTSGEKVETSAKSLQQLGAESAAPGLASAAEKISDKDQIKKLFYGNLVKVVDEKQKQNAGWFDSLKKLPEADKQEAAKNVVSEAWNRTKNEIISDLRRANIEFLHKNNNNFPAIFGIDKTLRDINEQLYKLDKTFDENWSPFDLPLDSFITKALSPSGLAMAVPTAALLHSRGPLYNVYKGITNQLFGGFSDVKLKRQAASLLRQARKERDMFNRGGPTIGLKDVDLNLLKYNRGQWTAVPVQFYAIRGGQDVINPAYAQYAGALTGNEERWNYRNLLPSFWIRDKHIFDRMFKNLKNLKENIERNQNVDIDNLRGLTASQKSFLQLARKDDMLINSLLGNLDYRTRNISRVPHVIEFVDENNQKHLMPTRQLFNLNRDFTRAVNYASAAATAASRKYWLPRLLLTFNPRGSLWSAIPIWGVPLIANTIFNHYFSSPEAHINRIARNLGPAYDDEVLKKVDHSLLDRMYQEFQKSRQAANKP